MVLGRVQDPGTNTIQYPTMDQEGNSKLGPYEKKRVFKYWIEVNGPYADFSSKSENKKRGLNALGMV